MTMVSKCYPGNLQTNRVDVVPFILFAIHFETYITQKNIKLMDMPPILLELACTAYVLLCFTDYHRSGTVNSVARFSFQLSGTLNRTTTCNSNLAQNLEIRI